MIFSLSRVSYKVTEADKRKAVFLARKMLPEYVFDASALEGNPITFPEVQTLMDGITVGGHKISDVQQVLNIRDAWNYAFETVKTNGFIVSEPITVKGIADGVNARIAREEALEWGSFRTGNVGIAGTSNYRCPPAEELLSIWNDEYQSFVLKGGSTVENAIRMFLWMSLNQFYWDGNKRTGRIMASGYLLCHGIGVFNIHARDIQEFNARMVAFYNTREGDDIAGFLAEKAIAAISG